MADSKHTPGPWSCRRDAQYYYSVYADELRVATASDLIADKGKANARLIAAAPDLLEVAQRILDRGYVSESIEEERGDHNRLVAAIAKATGAP